MKKGILLLVLIFSFAQARETYGFITPAATGWKAGVARVNITPKQPMWMAGYGVRTKPSEGTRLELWAKALAMEDANGQKAVLVTTDLLGLPKDVSDKIREQLQARYGLAKAQVLLNSSHTHSAPVVGNALSDVYPMSAAEWKKVPEYTRNLEEQLVGLVGAALKALEPVQLYAQNGVTRFQVNRRNNREAALLQQTELKGPNDYAVPVIKVVNAKGKLKAIAFGYACHPTVLNDYKWSGDYPGYAQAELEKYHPGATALFFQSAGADQNPLPRGTESLARQYGRELAAAVNRVLEEDMRELPATVKTAYTEVDLPLGNPPTEAGLNQLISETNVEYYKRWATRLLSEMKQGKPFRTQYPYPLQVWQLGDQVLMALGGELVVEYAIRLKQIFGLNTFVLGYSNDVMSYIPSEEILKEGGYEGETSQRAYGMHTTWAPGLEEIILTGLTSLAKQIGVAPAASNNVKTK
jgi:neutral ceramidase